MLPSLLLAASTAMAAPPPSVDLEDVEHWSARSRALLEGPPGCWELEGEATVRLALFMPGGIVGKPQRAETVQVGPFNGRLEDGLWTRLDSELVPLDPDSDIDLDGVPLHPMVGRVSDAVHQGGEEPEAEGDALIEAGEEDGEQHGSVSIGMSDDGMMVGAQAWGQAANLVDEIIEAVDPETLMVWAAWDEEAQAVKVVETMPLGERASAGEVTITSLHPVEGGPVRLDVAFPKRVGIRELPVKVTLMEPQLHLVAVETERGPMPAVESLSTILGVLGFTLGYEQLLKYRTVRGCE
jgi:hypothetical protein